MKRSFRILAAAAAVFALASCGGPKTDVFSEEMSIPLEEGRPDELLMSISLEYPVGKTARDSLMTTGIIAAAFDLEGDPGPVGESASRYESALAELYLLEGSDRLRGESADDPVLSWEDRINGYFTARKKGFCSYMIEYYSFRGGVHGVGTMIPLVFSEETGAVIPEEEFFIDSYKTPVSALLSAQLEKTLGKEEYDALFEKEIAPNGNYEPNRDGVTWYYQPYEIGPYSLGVVSVFLPWSVLKGLTRY